MYNDKYTTNKTFIKKLNENIHQKCMKKKKQTYISKYTES